MDNERGYSLIELLVTVAVVAVMATVAMLGQDFLAKHRVKSASREFYAGLQALRQQALTSSSDNASLGHGLIFTSDSEYSTFEFLDKNGDYHYDGTEEQANVRTHSVPKGVTIVLKSGSDMTENPVIYDRRGLKRDKNWSAVAKDTFIFGNQLDVPPACIAIDNVRIREGSYNEVDKKCTVF